MEVVPDSDVVSSDRHLSEAEMTKARLAAALVTIQAQQIRISQLAEELERYRVDAISAQLTKDRDLG
jgi:hypothetical protein